MMKLLQSSVKAKYLLILIFPLFYFFAGLYFRLILEAPSLRSIDPDYVYFMTGLNISEGFLKVIHIDHPGTPLQYLIALIFRSTWLFRDNPDGYIADVLSHSDLYLSIVNISITTIIAISLHVAGKYVLNKTRSVLDALLVQTIPLIPVILYEIIGRIVPELLLPLPIIGLTVFFIGRISNNKKQYQRNDLILLSFFVAVGISIKLTLIPIWIIPIIIVKGLKKKLTTIVMSFVFFLIIALPVTLNLEKFWNWTKALFIHSGQYGTGQENVINIAQFIENLKQIASLQPHFTILVIGTLLTIIILEILRRTKRQGRVNNKIILATAILLCIFAQTIISGKHYAPRYFMPALMFTPLLLFLFIEILKDYIPAKIFKPAKVIVLSVFLVWTLLQQFKTIEFTSSAFEKQLAARVKTKNYASTFEDESIKVIVSQDYGSPFTEYALQFSIIWSAHQLKANYTKILARMYPTTYQYTTWDGQFRYWGEPFNSKMIIDNNIPVYIYLEKNTKDLYNKTIDKLRETGSNFNAEKKLLFENPVNGECLLQLFISNPGESNPNITKSSTIE
ncbi:hypothetical protein [Sunxiuqinia indica]|uniref:hypothetical protein n=1 Tax=Sunxiuqinia indica TaxID=2692584 RepID=UPI001359FE60|nr:hypothetical protein [Sunxiuqinia indica]